MSVHNRGLIHPNGRRPCWPARASLPALLESGDRDTQRLRELHCGRSAVWLRTGPTALSGTSNALWFTSDMSSGRRDSLLHPRFAGRFRWAGQRRQCRVARGGEPRPGMPPSDDVATTCWETDGPAAEVGGAGLPPTFWLERCPAGAARCEGRTRTSGDGGSPPPALPLSYFAKCALDHVMPPPGEPHAGFPCVLSTAGPMTHRTDRGAPLRPLVTRTGLEPASAAQGAAVLPLEERAVDVARRNVEGPNPLPGRWPRRSDSNGRPAIGGQRPVR